MCDEFGKERIVVIFSVTEEQGDAHVLNGYFDGFAEVRDSAWNSFDETVGEKQGG